MKNTTKQNGLTLYVWKHRKSAFMPGCILSYFYINDNFEGNLVC